MVHRLSSLAKSGYLSVSSDSIACPPGRSCIIPKVDSTRLCDFSGSSDGIVPYVSNVGVFKLSYMVVLQGHDCSIFRACTKLMSCLELVFARYSRASLLIFFFVRFALALNNRAS